MDIPLTVQPSTALITTTNDPRLSPENDATTARARAKTLPLPTGHSKYSKAPGRISVSDAPALLRPLSSAYQGSSPRKYQFGTQQVDSDIGATPISPAVLAFHAMEFPALATGCVGKPKQSSPCPPSDSPTIPTLGRCAQSCEDDIPPPPKMVFEPSVNMNNPFTGPRGPGPMVSQLPPRSIAEDAMPENLSAETAQQMTEGLQSMTPNLELIPQESMYSGSMSQCWHQFRKIVEQHFVEQKHANEMLRQYYQDISFRLSQVEQQNRDVQWKIMTQSSPCHLDGPSDNFSSSQPDGGFDSFTLAHPGGHSDDFSSAHPGGVFENFSSTYPLAVPTEIVLATNRRKRVALAVETDLRGDLVQGGMADNNEGLHDDVDIGLTNGTNTDSVASVIPGSVNEVPPIKAPVDVSAMPLETPTPDREIEPVLPATPVTPSTSKTVTTPATGIKIIGRTGPPADGKTRTTLQKRESHDLAKSIPPAHVTIPLLPLTDTEIIVYLFNSISRPAVTARLYARQWGPATISRTLNEHREVRPPYLRNTCSVKCNTSLKLGRQRHGPRWEADYKAILSVVDDFKATDMIRQDDDEATVDYELRLLCVNLKKHPTGDARGIFTRCVEYCHETQATYTLANAHELAADLVGGKTPDLPESKSASSTPDDTKFTSPTSDRTDSASSTPNNSDSAPTRKRKRDDKDDVDESENDSNSKNGACDDESEPDDVKPSTPTPVKTHGADDLAAAYRDT